MVVGRDPLRLAEAYFGDDMLQYVSESTYRVWRLYMAACALEFESGEIGVSQVLASKRAAGRTSPPLTRRYMYPRAAYVGRIMRAGLVVRSPESRSAHAMNGVAP